ncbi:MAG: hypothetical protein EP343_06025 [Deltaproteobacteria bacterium]|nr:MAG: hypothetical protein EP343_06025 [Deltaproteobacteria bacterium]
MPDFQRKDSLVLARSFDSRTGRIARYLALWIGLFVLCAGFRCGPTALNCLEDSDCPPGHTCQSYQCLGPTPECLTSNDCSASQQCKNGRCEAQGAFCQGDQDCTAQQTCQNGTCIARCQPSEERCDGKDNNCNGKIDEDLTQSCFGGTPGQQDQGLCRAGQQTCQNGAWTACQGQVLPQEEVCDGKDNNCDGKVDETGCGEQRTLYQWCDDKNTCAPGLTCHYNMCYQVCDINKGEANNPDCSSLAGHKCWSSPDGKTVCKKNCTWPSSQPECPKGTHCLAKLNHCQPNLPPQRGPKQFNEPCSLTEEAQFCDAGKGLACVGGSCKKVCDPQESTTACASGSSCVPSDQSYEGGFCSP